MLPSNTSFKYSGSFDLSGPYNMSEHHKYLNDLAKSREETNAATEKKASLTAEQQANNQELQTLIATNPPSEKTVTCTPTVQKSTKTVQNKANEAYQITIIDLLNQDKTGTPPLHSAIIRNNLGFAKILLENGASVVSNITPPIKQSHQNVNAMFNLENATTYPTTASLHEPIVNFATQMLNTVGENAFPYIGFNALTLAISTNQDIEFIKDLCRIGKENDPFILNRCDGNGQTPLLLAAKEGKITVLNFLLELGANPNITDSTGNTPLDYAIKNESEKLKLVLVEAIANHLQDQRSVHEYAYDTKNLELLRAFKNHSEENSLCIKRFFLDKLSTILQKSDTDLSDFLNFISPVTDENILNEFFLQTAATPSTVSKLMIIQDKFNNPFPENMMFDLRSAASISGDSDQYEFAINIDKKFVDFLKNEQNKNTLSDSKVCSELSLAIAANNIEWVSIFLNHDENFLNCESRHYAKPLISQIADIQTDESIFKFIPENVVSLLLSRKNFDNKIQIPFIRTDTVQGFKKLLDAAGSLSNDEIFKYTLAEHAVKLNSTDLIDILIEKGVNLNLHLEDDDTYYFSLYAQALEDGNDKMVNHLISKGVCPKRQIEVSKAHEMNPIFGSKLERLYYS
jgi:ankyrin repeat protein